MPLPPAHNSDTIYVATYVEAMPYSADAARGVLRQIRDANRGNGGNLRCDLLERLTRPNHFVVLEAWHSEDAIESHHATATVGQLADHLPELLLSPCDVRSHGGLAVGPADRTLAEDRPEAVLYAVTHVDVIPPHKDEGVDLLAQLFEASPGRDGNLGFDVWQQVGRANHLTVVETWRDQAAFDDHTSSEPARQFRRQLTPLSGALYDQRLYRAVD